MTAGRLLLERRHALISKLAKWSLIAATALWLFMIVFSGTPGMADDTRLYLLDSNMRFVASAYGAMPEDLAYLWGGPASATGVIFLAGALSILGGAMIIRARFVHGTWSLGGFILLGCAAFAWSQLLGPIQVLYPAVIRQEASETLIDKLEFRQPKLVAQLRSGETPATSRVALIDVRVGNEERAADAMLEDRRAIDGLRFFLAQKAMDDGEKAVVRRLLPLDLPAHANDLGARNAFAARMLELQNFAGKQAVPDNAQETMVSRARTWQTLTSLAVSLRPLMNLLLFLGLFGVTLRWWIGRRLRRIDLRQSKLASTPGASQRKPMSLRQNGAPARNPFPGRGRPL